MDNMETNIDKGKSIQVSDDSGDESENSDVQIIGTGTYEVQTTEQVNYFCTAMN
jgi:hypothetical protein